MLSLVAFLVLAASEVNEPKTPEIPTTPTVEMPKSSGMADLPSLSAPPKPKPEASKAEAPKVEAKKAEAPKMADAAKDAGTGVTASAAPANTTASKGTDGGTSAAMVGVKSKADGGVNGAASKPNLRAKAPMAAAPMPVKPVSENAPEDATLTAPPSLTANALCEELRTTGKARSNNDAQLESEKKAIAKERQRLEALAADVQKARSQLKDETQRLEELLKKQQAFVAKHDPEGHEFHRDPPPKVGPLEKTSVEGIAKALHAMKPDQGATLLSRLDRTLASEVLRKMKPADVGAVMEKLKPEVAAELVSMMASAPPVKEAAR